MKITQYKDMYVYVCPRPTHAISLHMYICKHTYITLSYLNFAFALPCITLHYLTLLYITVYYHTLPYLTLHYRTLPYLPYLTVPYLT